jgi:hypothetical protein
MSGTVEGRRGRLRSALAAIVVVALLIPTGMLFDELRQRTADDLEQTRGERRAIEYLTRLMPLLSATTEVQSAALQGQGSTSPGLERAVAGVTEADQRLGADLGTRERWSNLRRTLGGLTAASAGGPVNVLQAHVESTDLLLALFDAVRDNSALVRDPDSDISHLQQAVAADLPQAVVLATRAADLALLVPNTSGDIRTQLGAGLAAAVAGSESAVNQLTDNLQQAVDDTGSRTLSSSLLGALDRFRRGIEALVQVTRAPAGPDPGRLAAARGDLQQGLTALSGTVLTETDALLKSRADALEEDRWSQWAVAGGAVLLALLGLLILLVRRRRTGVPARRDPAPEAEGRPDGLRADLLAAYAADGDPTRRERSGALR